LAYAADIHQDGKSFRIHNSALFSTAILPKYFRHSKLTSLQRQLNLYGFTHVTKVGDNI
jgi:hypothetical protein